MTPVRLLIIVFLLYILYKLLTGSDKRRDRVRKKSSSAGEGAVQDVLVEDPVCHTYIPRQQAVRLHHDKQMYYFCSNKCCEEFLKQKGAKE